MLSAVGLTAILLLSARVHAADDKVFPGTTCVAQYPLGNSNDAGWSDLDFVWDGAIANWNSTKGAPLLCAIERDNTTSSTGYTAARVDLYGNGWPTVCILYALDNDSTSYFHTSDSSNAVGYTALTFGSASAGSGWSLAFNCRLAQRHATNGLAYLKAIKVEEP
jgi:hypothetical protein